MKRVSTICLVALAVLMSAQIATAHEWDGLIGFIHTVEPEDLTSIPLYELREIAFWLIRVDELPPGCDERFERLLDRAIRLVKYEIANRR